MLEQEGFIEWQAYEHAWGNPIPSYSTDWSRGGPLINQMLVEGLQLKRNEYPRGEGTEFVASLPTPARFNFGPTPLLAALRCYVVSKLGETVEVPEDL
jgi:guanylate kinase